MDTTVIPTVIVGGIVAVIFVSIIVCQIRAKKRGKSSCYCNCSGCANAEACHKPKE